MPKDPFKSWNNFQAKLIYRTARAAAGDDDELFAKIVREDLTQGGFTVPDRFKSVEEVTPTAAKNAPSEPKE